MLTDKEAMKKLTEYAALFDGYVRTKEWGKAHNIYNIAHSVAVFMELGESALKILFGDWDSDDGSGNSVDNGLFRTWKVDMVNEKCCIERHIAYEDMECRKMGQPTRHYSEDDYCARCMQKKRAVR